MTVEGVQRRLESWIRDQKSKISIPIPKMPSFVLPQQVQWLRVKWPPWSSDREQRKMLQEEYERRRKQLQDLCWAVKAESVADLQDILCCMALSECVYKRPASDLIRAVNKFKADFGGQVICLERVQPSLEHVPHRYLLAEAGDTLFASFVGTKQYKDVVADVNIFQGAIFHDDAMEDMEETETVESDIADTRLKSTETHLKTNEKKPKQLRRQLKPAAHRGFMARAKGIPALELYRLAQKKKRKLVLCGHSLGGAVAALATLAILRVVAASSPVKENEKLQVKCITFSQPPVGNSALRDYVDRKGWQHYFKTYCIPEDLVPRILSPAYFHHYNTQANLLPVDGGTNGTSASKQGVSIEKSKHKPKETGGEQLVIGVGPVQTSFWRLSRMVPLEGFRRQIKKLKGDDVSVGNSHVSDSSTASSPHEVDAPQSLEIQEDSDGVSLKPIVESVKEASDSDATGKPNGKRNDSDADSGPWSRVPYLPSYVPFGQLYLLGTSSVELLSDAEYSNLTSVKSVIAELKERFQSHSMSSYRLRFQRIYDLSMSDNGSVFGMEQLQQFPHLHQWLGLSIAGTIEFGHIVETPSIRTASSIVPLGWSGVPGDKNAEPLKVDITGFALHQCTLIQAQVNGNWCSTTVESFPSAPGGSSDGSEQQTELQKMRILVGAPLRRPSKYQTEIAAGSLTSMFPVINSESLNRVRDQVMGAASESRFVRPGGLNSLIVYCTSDFTTVSREVDFRTRRVRFVGLEGAGKTTLLKAIMNQTRQSASTSSESLLPETDIQEGIAGGLCYMDSMGINLQELNSETSRFRDELWTGIRDLSRKIDLIVLVHNLAHKIPRHNSNTSEKQPALSLLLNEAKALGIPWVLAITNKFSVSAHQQKAAIEAVLRAYQASPSNTELVNSCLYVVHNAGSSFLSSGGEQVDVDGRTGFQNPMLGPLNLVRRPFQRKPNVLPVEGVTSLCQLIHGVLRSQEESSFEEFAKDRLLLEMARDGASEAGTRKYDQDKANSLSAATVGASLGAGLGIVLAVVMGAASALRKP